MFAAANLLKVFPDSFSVEQALIEATGAETACVDARFFLTWSEFVDLWRQSPRKRHANVTKARLLLLLAATARKIQPNPFGDFVFQPSFAQMAWKFISELKAGNCEPREFSVIAESLQDESKERCVFLAQLYEHFVDTSQRLGWLDAEDSLKSAIQDTQAGKIPSLIANCRGVEIESLYDISSSRLKFLTTLGDALSKQNIPVTWKSPASGSGEIDALIDHVYLAIEKEEANSALQTEKSYAYVESPFLALAQRLFRPVDERWVPEARPEILSCASVRQEAREIAHQIQKWAQEGTCPDEMAVAFRNIDSQAEWLVQELEEAGIPVELRPGTPLLSTRIGKICLNILKILNENFPRTLVAQALSNRLFSAVHCTSVNSVDYVFQLAGIQNASRAVRFNQDAYLDSLERLEQTPGPALECPVSEIQEVRKCFEKFRATILKIPERGSFFALLEAWWSSLQSLGLGPQSIESCLKRGSEPISSPMLLRSLEAERSAYDTLSGFVDGIRELRSTSAIAFPSISRTEFFRWLRHLLSGVHLPVLKTHPGGVKILDARELIGKKFERVWVGAMVEGRFPGPEESSSLVTVSQKRMLNELARKRLGRQGDVFPMLVGDLERRLPKGMAEDRLILFHAFVSAQKSLVFSYAREGAGQSGMNLSSFIHEILRHGQITEKRRSLQLFPLWEDVCTNSQLKHRVILETLARPDTRLTLRDCSWQVMREVFDAAPWFQNAALMAQIDEERFRLFTSRDVSAGPYSGQVDDPIAREYVGALLKFDREQPVSASILNQFGTCAFKGFVSHVMKIRDPQFPEDELPVSGFGSFLHTVMETLVEILKKKKIASEAIRSQSQAIVEDVINAATLNFEKQNNTGNPLLWRLSQAKARKVLSFLIEEQETLFPFNELSPLRTELEFGSIRAEPQWREVVLPPAFPEETPIYFRGKIDRLDASKLDFCVIDYKLSLKEKKTYKTELLKSEFQIPLYLFAARTTTHADSVNASWVGLKNGKNLSFSSILEELDTSLDECFAIDAKTRLGSQEADKLNFSNAVHSLVQSLRNGKFPARSRSCDHCSFYTACRIGVHPEASDE